MPHRQTGFSLIELLIVVALIMILGTVSSPFLANFIQYNNFDTASQNIVGSLRKAQNNALSNHRGQTWGVCQIGNIIRLYAGSCNSPVVSQDTQLENEIIVTGLSDLSFNRRGEPSSAATIIITSQIETKTYTVNTAGRISVQ